jgi:peptidoglycan-associated lipoprotein
MLKSAGIGLTAVLVAFAIVSGCARKPATTATTAPAPTGAALNSPGSGAGGSGSSVSTARPAAGQPRPTDAGRSSTAPVAGRPAVKDFAPVPDLVDIYFDFDKYDIRPGDARTLESNARWLRSNRDLVLIEGHCDIRGTNEYNLALGERRAKSTMNYLVAQGVAAHRITIVSYGEERPQCTQNDEACWSKNRRAHFLVKPQ